MTDHDIFERGMMAETIMRSDEFNALFAAVEADLASEFLNAPMGDADALNAIHMTMHGMRSFAQRLASYVLAKENVRAQADDPAQGN